MRVAPHGMADALVEGMTHTQTVATVLDATRPSGVLFHTLTPAIRTQVKAAGREYMLAHATGRAAERDAAEFRIIAIIGAK